ncbi:hypothetical protein F2Q70_00001773 [Brassica cretica]|uniref:Uncharacterized protein n=1 Tax=Brassica cretica TaxID=69181 RepID=A0A8S9IS60_BRACR|nr:hypothetical protein F2Q70_00001773 [Brassica cretica]
MIHQPGLRACLLRNQGYRDGSRSFTKIMSLLFGEVWPSRLNPSDVDAVADAMYSAITMFDFADMINACPHDHIPISRFLLRLVVFTVLVCGGVNERYDEECTRICKKVQNEIPKNITESLSVLTKATLLRLIGKKERPVRQPCDHSGEVKPIRIAILYSAETPRRIVAVNHTQIART